MTDALRGMSLDGVFRKRPRPVYVEGHLFVWNGEDNKKNGTVMWLPEDGAEMIRWLKKHMGQNKMVWIYRIRVDLVATGRVRDLTEEVVKC